MANKSLVMNFMNEVGKKVSIRLDGVKENITESDISPVMDLIIVKNIFQTNGGDLKVKDSAQLVSKDVTPISVK